MLIENEKGENYWAYGGDFGPDTVPSDGNFCLNGLVDPIDLKVGKISIENAYAFINTNNFKFYYELKGDGDLLLSNTIKEVDLDPGQTGEYNIDLDFKAEYGTEYFLDLYAEINDNKWMVDAGTILAKEQFKLPVFKGKTDKKIASEKLELDEEDTEITIANSKFKLVFNKSKGTLSSYEVEGKEFIKEGLIPNFWRAPTDNDFGNQLDKRSLPWRKAGQHRKVLSVKAMIDQDSLIAKINFSFEYSFEGNTLGIGGLAFTVDGSGNINVKNQIDVTDKEAPEFPRFGINLVMPGEFDQMSWFGRGPHESYWDRKTSAFVDVYSGSVSEQYWPYIRPQENGNKTDVRWMTITNEEGMGFEFVADELLEVSAHHNILEDFESPERTDGRQVEGKKVVNRHTIDVKPRDLTSVNIDFRQMGVGGDNSWGALTHPKYRLTGKSYSYSFNMRFIR